MGSSSAGLAGGHSHDCIQLARAWASAEEAGIFGILYVSSQAWNCSLSMWPLHLGSPCGLSSRVAIVFIGQLRALRSKSKTHALRFRPRTGTVSPSSCSVEKQVTDPAQIQGERTSKHHGYWETQFIGTTSDTDHHATQQGYLTLCPFPSHVWRPLRSGAVSSEPVHCPTRSEGHSGEKRRGNSANRGLETLALHQYYHAVTLDRTLTLWTCFPIYTMRAWTNLDYLSAAADTL